MSKKKALSTRIEEAKALQPILQKLHPLMIKPILAFTWEAIDESAPPSNQLMDAGHILCYQFEGPYLGANLEYTAHGIYHLGMLRQILKSIPEDVSVVKISMGKDLPITIEPQFLEGQKLGVWYLAPRVDEKEAMRK